MKKKLLPFFVVIILLGCSNQKQDEVPELFLPTSLPAPAITTGEHDRKIYIAAYDDTSEKFGVLTQKCIYSIEKCNGIEFLPIILKQNVISSMFWAPDGSKFATIIEENSSQEIAIIDSNGQNSKNITNTPGEIETLLGWASDSTKIIYQKDINQNSNFPSEIWIVDSDGGNSHKLLDGCCAQKSPEGRFYYLAPQNNDGLDMDIYMAETISGGAFKVVNLTNSPGTERKFSISSDGQKIAFASSQGYLFQLFLMNIDGTKKIPFEVYSANIDDITWSPDDSKIVFTSTPSHTSSSDVYVLDLKNEDLINLTNSSPYPSRSPIWSPDSSKILFVSDKDFGLSNIYVVNVDGSNLVRLTNANANLGFLSVTWQP